MKSFNRAFTLIELLIVVAIIAILAAIAVPNFLEAQTRSKVSRVKADLRAMATALESYFVDHNSHPPSMNGPLGPPFGANDTFVQYYPIPLSTPVAYLSQGMLPDPFGNEDFAYNPEAGYPTYYYTNSDPAHIIPAFVIGFSPNYPFGGCCSNNADGAAMTYRHRWYIYSAGPDRLHEVQRLRTELGGPSASGCEAYCQIGKNRASAGGGPGFYDPSNGTVSRGDIFRTMLAPDPKPRDFVVGDPPPVGF